jgi:hypothetical protein
MLSALPIRVGAYKRRHAPLTSSNTRMRSRTGDSPRTFKRFMGVTPSEFRFRQRSAQSERRLKLR